MQFCYSSSFILPMPSAPNCSSNSSPILLLQKGLCLDTALQFAGKLLYQNVLVMGHQDKIVLTFCPNLANKISIATGRNSSRGLPVNLWVGPAAVFKMLRYINTSIFRAGQANSRPIKITSTFRNGARESISQYRCHGHRDVD